MRFRESIVFRRKLKPDLPAVNLRLVVAKKKIGSGNE